MNKLIALILMTLCVFGFSPIIAGAVDSHSSNEVVQNEANSVQAFYAKMAGNWEGSYSLWITPWADEERSATTAEIKPTAGGKYFLMNYTWQQGGNPQAGVFLFVGKGTSATTSWGDSWHMAQDLMQVKGNFSEDGNTLIFLGSYAAGEGPDWGWRTEFTVLGPNAILMEAYNITPEGLEALAVKAEYTRAPLKGE